jgi:hypothetical protein
MIGGLQAKTFVFKPIYFGEAVQDGRKHKKGFGKKTTP